MPGPSPPSSIVLRTPFPSVTLSNGRSMPSVLLGTGASTWMNETSTATMVKNALLAGFPGVDTANHYRNQRGVATGIAAARTAGFDGGLWLQTKVEGCGNSVDERSPVLRDACGEGTLAAFEQNLRELRVPWVDLTLLHSPPCLPGAAWVDHCWGGPGSDPIYPHRANCSAAEPCEMMQQQWLALESVYAAGKSRSIGVSNFCAACLDCIAKVATVTPHVNQVQLHAGMPGADPAGLIGVTQRIGARVQAYRPLAQGGGSLLSDPTVAAIGRAHNKSAAEVALRWVVQLGHALVTSTENVAHMKGDLAIFDWALTDAEMDALVLLDTHPDDPAGGMCVL